MSALEPEGFDRCTAAPTSGEARAQAVIAALAVLAATLVALWRFRRLQLLAALCAIALSCVFWLWLLGDNQSCGVPVA